MPTRVEYDRVAPDYDRRFRYGGLPGVAAALRRATGATNGRLALEVGCGTGHWLPAFGTRAVLGADRSLGMLARAAVKRSASAAGLANAPPASLVAADAHALPFDGPAFDLVACVNALHHFGDPRRFVERAASLLRGGGALVIVGMDPSAGRDRWYLYDYFPESLPADLERYPPHAAIRRWMREAGLERVTTRVAQRIQNLSYGAEVLDDPILHRHGTSQLTMLDDAAFHRGMRRIQEAVNDVARRTAFVTDLVLPVTRGFVPRPRRPRRQNND
ncbi:MAG TPA: methyltransferase domain-containing protein [Thermoanaerobaculia bacterium]|nr:methyltransferase domain-containing protein [Thermoanaerobaculia bacterium]